MITVTFIRHGESTDNLRSVWAGWADAPLSNHGEFQAKAAGEYFATTPFTAIYASPLKRAFATAQAVLDAQPFPKPAFAVDQDLREQHWGVAEGKPWSLRADPGLSRDELYARGVYPVVHGDRTQKFPDGESLADLQVRAERAVDVIVLPAVWAAARTGQGAHLAIVSHGLCISELVAALVRKDRDAQVSGKGGGQHWTGLLNTAWTHLRVDAPGLKEGQKLEFEESDPPPLRVSVTHVNQHSHLDNIKRQQDGIGSAAHDPAQKDIRAFFGGGVVSSDDKPTEEPEEGRAASNACDVQVPTGADEQQVE